MKLLTKSTDINHLYILKDLLEANGIPAMVKGDNTARMITPFLMTEPSLWVYLDDQFDEAEALILDPDYQVENGIDMGEFHSATREISTNPKHLNVALLNLGVGFTAILFVLFLLIMWLSA
jgi:hypothetical protein